MADFQLIQQTEENNAGVFVMSEDVLDIPNRIEQLPKADCLVLKERLALAAVWRREAEEAQKMAPAKGIGQAAIDRAVE